MSAPADAKPVKTVLVVGGGLSGALFGLKLIRARPDFRVLVVEQTRRLARGVAYGACSPFHLLNVPVSRMEVGLQPSFGDWLTGNPEALVALTAALKESGGDLQAAFAPRALFGAYLHARVTEALTTGEGPGLAVVRGEVVRLLSGVKRGVKLADGREIDADTIVLATGNLPPRTPGGADGWLYDSANFVPDPWAADAFDGLGLHEPVLLLGAGLTTVDVALKLTASGHKGPILAISRRGLAPRVHAGGGAWPAFLEEALPASPGRLMRLIREQVAAAEAQGIPWQRVFDAARPAVPIVWRSWTDPQKRQFMRHLRTRWDVHRHRIAPRIHDALNGLIAEGRLEMRAARVRQYRPLLEDGVQRVEATLRLADGEARTFVAARVVNCTGPRRDLDRLGIPLLADLRERRLAIPDSLGLGLETEDCAVLDATRRPSDWLYALGPLTCPSWWEITAVPEISVQVDHLVAELADTDHRGHAPLTAGDFLDLGGGI